MEIRIAKYLVSSPGVSKCPKPDRPEYAFIGRSNVGKSSLINMLTGHKGLAKISASPGKTQMINHFDVQYVDGPKNEQSNCYLVDLPGYGYAKVSQTQRAQWARMIEDYLKHRENLMTVFVLVDSRLEPQESDLAFLKKLADWQAPFNLIFTKADKSSQRVVSLHVRLFVDAMRREWEFIPRSFVTSSEKGTGRKEILEYIAEINKSAAQM